MQLTEKNYKEKISKGQRNLFKLENQLDVLSKKTDEVVNEISNLRQQIDHMLLDRFILYIINGHRIIPRSFAPNKLLEVTIWSASFVNLFFFF